MEKKTFLKWLFIYFDSNNRILIPLSSLFYLHFDQMGGTWPIWSRYPIDPIIRDPIKRWKRLRDERWNATIDTFSPKNEKKEFQKGWTDYCTPRFSIYVQQGSLFNSDLLIQSVTNTFTFFYILFTVSEG